MLLIENGKIAESKQTDTINLLWTAGWDSTFRLLDLILIEKRKVQPYYVIDTSRKSMSNELKTMGSIKNYLFSKHKYTHDLLLPTKFTFINDIPENNVITQKYLNIRAKRKIAYQQEWLSRFVESLNIAKMELCVEMDEDAKSTDFYSRYLNNYLIQSNGESSFRLSDDYENDELDIFKRFTFPIIHLTKTEMREIAAENGFDDIMDMTWFCITPTRSERPCGTCIPCKIAMRNGMKYRIPPSRRVFFYMSVIKEMLNNLFTSKRFILSPWI